jgi:hypothetical protein
VTTPVRTLISLLLAAVSLSCSGRTAWYLADPAFPETGPGETILREAPKSASRRGMTLRPDILPESGTESAFFARLETIKRGVVFVSPLLLSQAETARDQFPDIDFIVPFAFRAPERDGIWSSMPDRDEGLRRTGRFLSAWLDAYAGGSADNPVAGWFFGSDDPGGRILEEAFSAASSRPFRSGILPDGANAKLAFDEMFRDNIRILFVSQYVNIREILATVPEAGVVIVLEAPPYAASLHPGIAATLSYDCAKAADLALEAWTSRDPEPRPVPPVLALAPASRASRVGSLTLKSVLDSSR